MLASVTMYASAAECWANWPRSLSLRDATVSRWTFALGLGEIAALQALPLWVLGWLHLTDAPAHSLLSRVNRMLLIARLGVLWGTRRAYGGVPPTYWLSPLCDLPALLRIAQAALERAPTWRGRTLVGEREAA